MPSNRSIDAYVDRLVSEAPQLTLAQRDRLALLLRHDPRPADKPPSRRLEAA